MGWRGLWLLFAMCSLFGFEARSQALIQFYTQNTSTTTFTPITGGTAVSNGPTADDERYVSPTQLGGTTTTAQFINTGLPIGFTFNFNNYEFDRFAINANGWISLGQSALGASAVNINSTSGYTSLSATNTISPVQLRSRIAGFNRDLQGQAGSSIRFETIGSAPNRVLVVQWLGFKRWGTSGTGDNLNFQIRLLEGSNNIEIVYGTMTFGSTASTGTHMGISGNSNGTTELLGAGPTQTNGNSLSFTNTSASLGWSVGSTNTPPTSGRRYTFTAPVVCSGTPNPGNTLAASNPTCGNVGTTLSLQNNVGTGIQYQWQSSPDGTTWNNIAGATNPTYSTGAMTSDTYYRASVTCTLSAQTAFSNPVQVTLNSFLVCYCPSTAAFTSSHDVLNVTFGTINNTTPMASLVGTQGTAVAGSTADLYSNFAGSAGVPIPSLQATQTNNLDITVASTSTFSQTFTTKVWIDWNRDGDFTDGGEEVFNSGAISAITSTSAPRIFNTSIFTPVWVASGQTRMRVSTRTTSINFDPCYTTGSGETEDYIVNLVALPVCSGTPNGGTANPSFANLCVGTGVNISLNGATVASGIQYQWQESSDNVSWSNISNAFGLIYQNTFSNPNLGAATVVGNAAISNGTMVLNPLASNTFGSLLIPGTGAVSSTYRVKFDLNVSRPGSTIYADGVSYSFGDDVNPNNDANMNAENGTGTKLKIGFVTYTNGTSLNGIYLMYNCTINEQTPTTPAASGMLAYSSDVSWRGVNTAFQIDIDSTGKVTVSMNGTPVTGLTNIQLPASYLTELRQYWRHCFKARTGAETTSHIIDNFEVYADGVASGPSYNIPSYNGTAMYYRSVLTCTNSSQTDNSTSSLISGPGAPTQQDSLFVLTSPESVGSTTATTTGSLGINWTNASAVTGRIIKINTTNSFTDPVDGQNYSGNLAYSGTGEQIVFAGSSSGPITITGLNPGVAYWVRSYTYGDCGAGNTYYNTATAQNNPRRFFTSSLDTMRVTYTPSGVTFNSLFDGLTLKAGALNPTWNSTSGDDNYSRVINLPFTFEYQGQPVNHFRATTNGALWMDTTVLQTGVTNNLSSTSTRSAIAPYWDDLVVLGNNFANINSCIAYQVTGTAPNRVMTVEWANMEVFNQSSPNLNYQVKLYETTNNIEFVYGNMTPFTGAASISLTYSIGLNSFATTFGGKDVFALASPRSNRFQEVDPTSTASGALNLAPACFSSYLIRQGLSYQGGTFAADPGNDEPAGALTLDVSPASQISSQNCQRFPAHGSTWSAGYTRPAAVGSWVTMASTTGGDRWYKFTLNNNPVQFGIDVAGSNLVRPVVELYSGSNPASLTFIAAAVSGTTNANGTGRIASYTSTTTTAGSYYLRVYHHGDTTTSTFGGLGDVGIDVYAVIPPAIDSLAGADTISVTSSCSPTSDIYSTSSSFTSLPAPTTAVTNLKDNWHVFQATGAAGIGGVNIVVTPTVLQFNPKLEVFNLGPNKIVDSANAANRIGTFDGVGLGVAESGTLSGLTVGNWYAVRVYHSAGGTGGAGNYRVCLTPNLEFLNFDITKTPISTSAYGSIANTGTSFTWGTPFNGDDVISDTVAMPFPFTYAGRNVVGFRVSTNGWMTLASSAVTSSALGNNLNSGATARAVIAPFWDDMVAPGNTTAGLITGFKYETKGTAPNRILYVEFIGLEKFGYAGPSLNAQVRIYENGGRIDIVYGNSSFYDGTATSSTIGQYTYSVGMNGWGTGTLSGNQLVALGSVGGENFGSTDPANLAGAMPCYTRYSFVPNATTAYVAGAGEPNITNNECSTATVLPVLTSTPTEWCSQYSLKGATASTSATAPGPNATSNLARKYGRDVWFTFAGALGKKYAFDLRQGTGTNVGMAIYSTRSNCGSLTPVAHIYDGTGGSTQDTELVALQNVTYYIRVYQNDSLYTVPSGNNGYFNLVAVLLPPPPANDEPSGAIRLTSSFAIPTSLPTRSVIDANITTTPAFCATSAADVWYVFRADYNSHTIRVTPVTPGTQFNPAIQVFSTGGGAFVPTTLTSFGCATTAAMNVQEVFSSTSFVPGQVYYVRVSNQTGGKGGTGNFTISLTHPDIRDISIENITATAAGNGSGSAGSARNIRYIVKNNGPSAYSGSGVTFSFSRNGSVLASTTPALNLGVGDTTSVYFSTTLTPTLNAIDTVKFYHSFASDFVRSNDTVTVNYNSTSSIMNYAWSKGYGSTLLDEGRAVTVDGSGNVISAGIFSNQVIVGSDTLKGDYRLGRGDVMIVKSDSLGNSFWARSITGSNLENVRSVATDASGNIYVAGSFQGLIKAGNVSLVSNGQNPDGFIVKYSSNGVVQYAIKVGGTGSDVINDIKVDANNLYFVGGFGGTMTFGNSITSAGESDVMVGSMNLSTGVANWVVQEGGYSYDMGNALALDNGFIYTTGYFCNNRDISGPYNLASSGVFNMFVGKHNASNGSTLWGRTLSGTGSEYGNGIAVDASGNVIVSGTFNLHIDAPGARVVSRMIPTRGAEDIFVTKFLSNGTYQWVYTMGGTGSDNFGKLATYNANNNIVGSGFYQNNSFFRGYSLNSTGLGDMFVYSADANGNTNWVNRSSSSTGSFAKTGSDVAVSASGAVYVTGTVGGTTTFGATTVTGRGQTDMVLNKLLTGVAGMVGGPQMRESLTSRVVPTTDMPEISSFNIDWLTNELLVGEKEVTLRWFASQEIANSKYVIEQSTDGINWTMVRTVAPTGSDKAYSSTMDRSMLENGEVMLRVRLQTTHGIYSNSPSHVMNNVRSANEMMIAVYPNPSNDVVTLQSSTPMSNVFVEVTSVDGKVVRRVDFNTVGNAVDLNVSDLSNGIYLLNIHTNNSVTTKKITVQH